MSLDLSILKVLISNKKLALEFSNECDSKLFSPDVWNFANIIVSYLKTYKELPTLRVLSEKAAKGKNDKLIENIKKIWTSIEAIEYNDKEYKHDLEKIKKRFAEKQILDIKEKFSSLEPGSIDIGKAVADLQKTAQNIKNLNQSKTFERKTLKESIASFREEYNAKMEDPHFDAGIKTGYSYFDNVTDGLRSGELVLIGADTGAGKSMLLMNMAIQMWMQDNIISQESSFSQGYSVLYFTLEMPFKPCLNRVLARLSNNPSKLIRNAKLNPEEALKLKKALKFINRYPHQFEIVDVPRGATMESLEIMYEEAKINYDPKIIVIDYLGLMDYDGKDMEDHLKLLKIAEKMHEFARVHNLIVLSAVQLNRPKAGKEAEDRIGIHRVGRSAGILHNANIAIQIETRPKESLFSDMIYHIIKCRDGALGKSKLIKNLACGTLLDDPVDEDQTEFYDRNPDDISEKLELLDL